MGKEKYTLGICLIMGFSQVERMLRREMEAEP